MPRKRAWPRFPYNQVSRIMQTLLKFLGENKLSAMGLIGLGMSAVGAGLFHVGAGLIVGGVPLFGLALFGAYMHVRSVPAGKVEE